MLKPVMGKFLRNRWQIVSIAIVKYKRVGTVKSSLNMVGNEVQVKSYQSKSD